MPGKRTTRTTRKKAPKKNGVKKNGARKPRPGQELHPHKIRGKLQLEFKMAAMEVELKRSKLEKTNAEIGTLSMDPQHAPVFALMKRREEISTEMRDAVIAFASVQKRVADKVGIPYEKLHEYTIDTDTGAMIPSPVKQT